VLLRSLALRRLPPVPVRDDPDLPVRTVRRFRRRLMVRRARIVVQTEPSHWTTGGWHDPRRCLICLAERLYVKLGLAVHEED
jgi:hypothetical protein